MSPEALRLHVYGILASIESGQPGFIADTYLDALTVETSMASAELCLSDLWQRADDGYIVLESETMRVAGEVHRQLQELSEQCRARGGHQPDPDHPDLCSRCAVRLR